MIITGESGSGKTLSYLLPIVNELNNHKDTKLKELGSVTDLIFEGINPILKGISIRKELSGIEL